MKISKKVKLNYEVKIYEIMKNAALSDGFDVYAHKNSLANDI